ncbi:uncharacterized protein Gasu_26920 [Galdieria sulphuraria]|uniref:Uncharacterized protein n=1 Tax=Galdieria sulphuraria TaxID=130081 RepID=M2W2J6_GALSU|nr:uncharacterized protein Gasu_26920 [Galdieria sulphuraria]EME29906.1 hypothetical protein Gasu_26920 [Galdieria sulphuraria]|eukprot:XP_005706426.1 hypothetical protein Gasu_26920 [Galdieria sulphuraria]
MTVSRRNAVERAKQVLLDRRRLILRALLDILRIPLTEPEEEPSFSAILNSRDILVKEEALFSNLTSRISRWLNVLDKDAVKKALESVSYDNQERALIELNRNQLYGYLFPDEPYLLSLCVFLMCYTCQSTSDQVVELFKLVQQILEFYFQLQHWIKESSYGSSAHLFSCFVRDIKNSVCSLFLALNAALDRSRVVELYDPRTKRSDKNLLLSNRDFLQRLEEILRKNVPSDTDLFSPESRAIAVPSFMSCLFLVYCNSTSQLDEDSLIDLLVQLTCRGHIFEFLDSHLGEFLDVGYGSLLEDVGLMRDGYAELIYDIVDLSNLCSMLSIRCREAIVRLLDRVENGDVEMSLQEANNNASLIAYLISLTGRACKVCDIHSYRIWNAQSGNLVSFYGNVVVEIGDIVERNSEIPYAGPVFFSTVISFFRMLKYFAKGGHQMTCLVLNFLSHSGHPFASLERIYLTLKYYCNALSKGREQVTEAESKELFYLSEAEGLTLAAFIDTLDACALTDEQLLLTTLTESNIQELAVLCLQLSLLEIPAKLKASLIHFINDMRSERLSFHLLEHLFGGDGIGIRREYNQAIEHPDALEVVCAMLDLAKGYINQLYAGSRTLEGAGISILKNIGHITIRTIISNWKKMEYLSALHKWQLAFNASSLIALLLAHNSLADSQYFSVIYQIYTDICHTDNILSVASNCFHNVILMMSADGEGEAALINALDSGHLELLQFICKSICCSCIVVQRLTELFKSHRLGFLPSSVGSLSDLISSESTYLSSLLSFIGLGSFPFSLVVYASADTLCSCAACSNTFIHTCLSSTLRQKTRSTLCQSILDSVVEAPLWEPLHFDVNLQKFLRRDKVLESLLYFVFCSLGTSFDEEAGLYLLGFENIESIGEGIFSAVVKVVSVLAESQSLSDKNLAVSLSFLSLICSRQTTSLFAFRYIGLHKMEILTQLLTCYGLQSKENLISHVVDPSLFCQSFSSSLRLIALCYFEYSYRNANEGIHIAELEVSSHISELFSSLTLIVTSFDTIHSEQLENLFSSWYQLLLAATCRSDSKKQANTEEMLSSWILQLLNFVDFLMSSKEQPTTKTFLSDNSIHATVLLLLRKLHDLSIPRLSMFYAHNIFVLATKTLILWMLKLKESSTTSLSLWTSLTTVFQYLTEYMTYDTNQPGEKVADAKQIFNILSQHAFHSRKTTIEWIIDIFISEARHHLSLSKLAVSSSMLSVIIQYTVFHRLMLGEFGLDIHQLLRANGRLRQLFYNIFSSGHFQRSIYRSIAVQLRSNEDNLLSSDSLVRYARADDSNTENEQESFIALPLLDSLLCLIKSMASLEDVGVLTECQFTNSLIPFMEFVADGGSFVHQMNVRLESSSNLLSSGLRNDELLIHSGLLAPVETSIHIISSLIQTASSILCNTLKETPPKSLLDLCLSCLDAMETPLRQIVRSPGFVIFISNLRLVHSLGQLLVLIAPFAASSPIISSITKLCFEAIFRVCQDRDVFQLEKSVSLHIEGSYVPRIQPTDLIQLSRNNVFHPENGSLLERDYLYVRCQCRRIYLFLLHLLPSLWKNFSLNSKPDSVDGLKTRGNVVSSLSEICGCVFAAYTEMKFFDEEADKMELYSRDTSKTKLFVDFTKEEYATNIQEPSFVLSAIKKDSTNARSLATVCFYALENGLLVIDRILTMCKDQLYGEPNTQIAAFSFGHKYSAVQLERILKDARDVILPFCQKLECAPRGLWKNRDASFTQAVCRHIRIVLHVN